MRRQTLLVRRLSLLLSEVECPTVYLTAPTSNTPLLEPVSTLDPDSDTGRLDLDYWTENSTARPSSRISGPTEPAAHCEQGSGRPQETSATIDIAGLAEDRRVATPYSLPILRPRNMRR